MQDGLPAAGKASQAKTLQKGIDVERNNGLKNLLGVKTHFGAFLVSSDEYACCPQCALS